MSKEFSGKVALITGGGSNIGLAIATLLAERGASVALVGRNKEQLDQAAVNLRDRGNGIVLTVAADVTDESEIERAVDRVAAELGGLDIAVNNAGIVGAIGPLVDMKPDDFRKVLETNTVGTFLSMQSEIRAMKRAGSGVIVNTASNIGVHGRRLNMAAYAASKAAVSVMTRNAALESINAGIRINAVSPGATDTPLSFRPGEDAAARDARVASAVPIGRVAKTSEIAEAVVWLASDRSSYVVGHDLVVDGGTTA